MAKRKRTSLPSLLNDAAMQMFSTCKQSANPHTLLINLKLFVLLISNADALG
jgi:hypothetical protein